MIKTFTMSQEDYDAMLDGIMRARSTPMIALQCGEPPSIQAIANEEWRKLGEKMGFKHMTVRPHQSGNKLMFTAETTP